MTTKKLSIVGGVGALLASSLAFADDTQPTPVTQDVPATEPAQAPDTTMAPEPVVVAAPGVYSYAWREPYLKSQIGIGVTLGGGITGFTDSAMRNISSRDVGGLWDLRVSLGTHVPIGLDLSYVGTATPLQTFTGASNGQLLGTTAEAALRYNIMPHAMFTPYLFGGIGWQRYDVTNAKFAQADTGMLTTDDLVEFPMGLGFGFRDRSGLVGDVRGTFRAAAESNLVTDQNGNHPQLHSWEASAAIGYEF